MCLHFKMRFDSTHTPFLLLSHFTRKTFHWFTQRGTLILTRSVITYVAPSPMLGLVMIYNTNTKTLLHLVLRCIHTTYSRRNHGNSLWNVTTVAWKIATWDWFNGREYGTRVIYGGSDQDSDSMDKARLRRVGVGFWTRQENHLCTVFPVVKLTLLGVCTSCNQVSFQNKCVVVWDLLLVT